MNPWPERNVLWLGYGRTEGLQTIGPCHWTACHSNRGCSLIGLRKATGAAIGGSVAPAAGWIRSGGATALEALARVQRSTVPGHVARWLGLRHYDTAWDALGRIYADPS